MSGQRLQARKLRSPMPASERKDELVGYILARLDNVRPTHRGWTARCPAHDDRSPSLSLRAGERAILIKCFAGCPVNEICRAIGIEVRDLFFDTSKPRLRQSGAVKLSQRPRWRATATALGQHAMGLYLRSESVLETAKGLDTSDWSPRDLECAMQAVNGAYRDVERAALLEEVAYSLRAKGLETEKQGYESRSRAINNSR